MDGNYIIVFSMNTKNRKRVLLLCITSILCFGAATFALTNFVKNGKLGTAADNSDYYSITINAEDVTTSSTIVSGTYVAYTDQLNNPITFNYENIKFEQDGENNYLVFGEGAFFANDKNSQIRKIDNFRIYGDDGVFSYDYGWSVKLGSVQYTGEDHSGYANGGNISCGINQPNYFALMHRDGEADVKISKIVYTYSKDCTPGEKPIPAVVLDYIVISGQTSSLNRGSAFTFGGTIIAHYSDGSTSDVTASTTFSGYDMSTSGTYTVVASYSEGEITKTASYTLTVNKAWSSLWSGSKKLYWNCAYAAPSAVDVYTSSLTGTVDIRVTFTTSTKNLRNDCTLYYINNQSWNTSKPSSPVRFSSLNTAADRNLIGIFQRETSNLSEYEGVCLQYLSSSKKFQITPLQSGQIVSGELTLTITKIERYY